MTTYLLTNHLLNFLAPAAVVALLLVLLGRVFSRFLRPKKLYPQSLWVQAAIIFIVSVFLLAAGLVLFGNDGKMATYTAMVLGAAFCQWVLWRGWKA